MLANATYPGRALGWNGGVFPAGAGISTAVIPCNLMAVDPNLKNAYVASWNFGIQHALANNLSLEVRYVGNVGERLIFFRDINHLNPATGVRPYAASFPLPTVHQSGVDGAYSNYNSLQVTLTKRMSHGLSFRAGYTYGHGRDKGSLNRFGTLPQDSLNPATE